MIIENAAHIKTDRGRHMCIYIMYWAQLPRICTLKQMRNVRSLMRHIQMDKRSKLNGEYNYYQSQRSAHCSASKAYGILCNGARGFWDDE